MTKNQKIALGCGGLGCFGLIVVIIVCAGVYFYYSQQRPGSNSNTNRSSYNFNTNRSSNSNGNSNSNSSTASTSMSDDDKHKLFQAASMTQDAELVKRVGKKIGLLNDDESPSDEYGVFVKDHILWAFKNGDFIKSVSTPETAKAYVEANLDE